MEINSMSNDKKRKKKKIIIFGGMGILLVILVLVVAFGSDKEKIVAINVEKVERRTITQTVEGTGKIEPQTQVKINAEVSGEIIELPVKEGDKIKKGQLLVRIKPDTYIADRDQAIASLNSAKAMLLQRKADETQKAAEYHRAQELHAKKLISDSDLELAKASYDIAVQNVESAKYSIQNAKANLDRAVENLRKTSIFSPITGVVTELISKLGERVSGSSFTQGTHIMTVSNLEVMEARVEVDENDVVLVSLGDTARIYVDAYPDSLFVGTVYQIANTAKTSGLGTQEEVTNFEVRILLYNPGHLFRPGMSCNADIETETHYNVLAVPLQSVTTRERKISGLDEEESNSDDRGQAGQQKDKKSRRRKPQEVVFVVKNDRVKMVDVTTSISDDEYIEITSGLKEGDKVVSGSYRAISRELQDSTRVRIEKKKNRFGSANKD